MKKILAILVTFSMLICMTSCAKISVTVPNQANPGNSTDNNLGNDDNNSQLPDDFNNNFDNQDNSQNNNSDNSQDNNPPSGELSDNPAEWSKAQIVDYYKKAAGKTHNSVTSYQKMTMRKDSLNAPGINGTLLNFAEGVMSTALSNNSMDIKGITGGHWDLKATDVKSAKAYKSGNNTIIEMTMVEQIDKGNGDMYSGTVGHAISVVGDIDSVIGQFSGLGMNAKIADKDCTLHYKNPVLKVKINGNGIVVNGTWSYVVYITLNNLEIKAMGLTVPVAKATSIVDFVVTLSGGFKA